MNFFRVCFLLLAGLSAGVLSPAGAQTVSAGQPASANVPAASAPVASTQVREGVTLTTVDAIILGVVEGVTEFLPISSTGHLIIVNEWLGLNDETPLLDAAGQPRWLRAPSAKHPEGKPLTLKVAADTYAIVIQFGAIAAVAGLYWRHIRSILLGVLGRDAAGWRLGCQLVVAFIPAVVLGLALNDWIDRALFTIPAVIVALVAGAILMLIVESWRKQREQTVTARQGLESLDLFKALKIGLLQCVALWPGTSRSMMTLVGGFLVGMDARRSAEFSFLLGLLTLTAAAGYKSLKAGPAMLEVFGLGQILLGCLVAAVTAAVAVKFLIHYLTRHGLALFAWYRLVLAAGLAAWYWL